MLLSKYFLPTLKENQADAEITSHQLMLRAGLIRPLTSGIYAWLPIGLKVLEKISSIIKMEMNSIGGLEMLTPCIQPAEIWKKSGRYGEDGELMQEALKIKDRKQNDLLFTPTAEEAFTLLFCSNIQSYKDLPKLLYQTHWKFRDEIRPRYGVMRAREFFMKDAYSFDIDEDSALSVYKNVFKSYIKLLKTLGFTPIPVSADSGDMGGEYSHEFHILAPQGESTIYYEKKALDIISNNTTTELETLSQIYACEESKHKQNIKNNTNNIQNFNHNSSAQNNLIKSKSIEVGHIFYLGDKYSKAMKLKIQDKNGKLLYPQMGCYGIGISRIVAAIIEANHDDRGIIWPTKVTPFDCLILNLCIKDQQCNKLAHSIYQNAKKLSLEVLLDDTESNPGVKMKRADLIGVSVQIIIGPKGLKENHVEIRYRDKKINDTQKIKIDTIEQFLKKLSNAL